MRKSWALAPLAALGAVAARDLVQREHAVLRNFPVVGHARYLLESVGPELRQYIVTSNDEERPFSRDQRRWVYASSKREINTFGFRSEERRVGKESRWRWSGTPWGVRGSATRVTPARSRSRN